jgi:putative membrane protein
MRSTKHKLLLFLRGVAMGAVDLVPGISAGTIAFVTGIYEELLHSIKSFNLDALKVLKNQGFAAAWRHINGEFLIILLSGILFSLFTLAGVMRYFLEVFPLQLWSFFMGLIIASVIYLLRQYPPKRLFELCLLGTGILAAYSLSTASAVSVEGNYVSLFFAGSIALCAMILPGISGSFILVLLGLYPVFINALDNVEIDFLLTFAAGGVVGLMLFSRLLSWLLDHFKHAVIALMCGFLIGSLSILWPWKQVTASVVGESGQLKVTGSINLLPQTYLDTVGQDPHTLACALLFLSGLLIVLTIELISVRLKNNVPKVS